MTGINYNQRQAAEVLDVSTRTLRDWDNLPTPPPRTQGKRGQPNTYPARELITWYVEHRISQLIGDADGTPLDLAQERAKLAKAQCRKIEMDNAVKEQRLFAPDVLVKFFDNVLQGTRQKLLALPRRAAPLVHGCKTLGETSEAIRVAVYEALTDLAESKAEDILALGAVERD